MRQIFLNGILRYRKQLPNEITALPTSASSPPPFWARSCTSSHGYDPYTTTHELDAYDVTFCIRRTGTPRTARCAHVHRQDTTGPPARGRRSLVSVLGRSPTPDGPTACLMPTRRTRQRISRHSPSPLHTTHRLAERRPSVSPLS
jgi:hypothetical protein